MKDNTVPIGAVSRGMKHWALVGWTRAFVGVNPEEATERGNTGAGRLARINGKKGQCKGDRQVVIQPLKQKCHGPHGRTGKNRIYKGNVDSELVPREKEKILISATCGMRGSRNLHELSYKGGDQVTNDHDFDATQGNG